MTNWKLHMLTDRELEEFCRDERIPGEKFWRGVMSATVISCVLMVVIVVVALLWRP